MLYVWEVITSMLNLDTLEPHINLTRSLSVSEKIHVKVDMSQIHHIQSSDRVDMKDYYDQNVQ